MRVAPVLLTAATPLAAELVVMHDGMGERGRVASAQRVLIGASEADNKRHALQPTIGMGASCAQLTFFRTWG